MRKLLHKLISLRIVKAALQVKVATYHIASKPSFYSPHFFEHAVATPLTVLQLEVEFLARHFEQFPEHTEVYKRLIDSTNHLRLLFEEFFVQKPVRPFVVIKALEEVKTLYDRRNGIVLFAHLSSGIMLSGSQTLFKEVLICVINNALEAYPQDDKKQVALSVKKVASQLVIEVIDFGTGMSRSALLLAKIAGVTYKQKGSGLGISFCKKVIKDHFGGYFKIESKLQFGTKVLITVPIR